MSDITDIDDKIDAVALKAKSVTADGVSVTQQSVSEIIAARNHKANVAAAADPAGVMRAMFVQVHPPGGH